jgi:hypothetical protein
MEDSSSLSTQAFTNYIPVGNDNFIYIDDSIGSRRMKRENIL